MKQETVSDFKARITQIMREKETGKKWSLIGASRAPGCVLRKKVSRPLNKSGQQLSNPPQ